MRKTVILLSCLLCISCAKMHNPILHGGGKVKFILTIDYDIDSIFLDRMNKYWIFEDPIFWNGINDYHCECSHIDLDFINHSENTIMSYGLHNIKYRTNEIGNLKNKENYWYTLNQSQPSELYSINSKVKIPERLSDYNEEFVFEIRDTLKPRVFPYFILVTLKNNNNRVIGSGGFKLTGLSSGVNLDTYINSSDMTSHVISTQYINDHIIGKLTSFGFKGVDPYEFRNIRNIDSYNSICTIQLVYDNGRRLIDFDITDQIILQPTGGLILIDVDIDKYPGPIKDFTDPFEINVEDYEGLNEFYQTFY